ncbi:TPA: sodium:calcium antiporter [Thermoplasmata archaeon]|nr:sodium:calcium antiporter [Thermoplasmata archaeon]
MALEAITIAVLVVSLLIILLSCEVFTNGIEWLGCRLGIAETATGSILAAIGTAMPETIIPIIAIFMVGEEGGKEIGEGAILGAPFMLGTLAMFVGGLSVLLAHKRKGRPAALVLRENHAERDMEYFMLAYSLALVTALVGMQSELDLSAVKYVVAVVLIVAYVFYLRRTLKDECAIHESSCPVLYLTRVTGLPTTGRKGLTMILFQVIAALAGIIVGAKFFVGEVEIVAEELNIDAMILAFLVAPLATELPEKFNSVIWYWRSKDTLALGNITGAMVFQSSIPVSIGLLFTEWSLEWINIASILIALAAAAWIYYCVKIRNSMSYKVMLAAGSLYLLYILLLLTFPPSV